MGSGNKGDELAGVIRAAPAVAPVEEAGDRDVTLLMS